MSAVTDAAAVLTTSQVPRGYSNDDYSGRQSSNLPTQQDFVNIFGPAGADVKLDKNRFGRMNRVHIPDVLKGPNQWMTDRVDGLITDTTNSPYTTLILPYKYIETPDAKFKWNVWSFDEGLASRVPYEAAARTLTQSKREFAGFTVRQGLAITMEVGGQIIIFPFIFLFCCLLCLHVCMCVGRSVFSHFSFFVDRFVVLVVYSTIS